jgi:class 3 adenylate cyclase/tetratricopeptide (TPR) repeat protein
MSSCLTCGSVNPDRAKFCLECGTPLPGPGPTREERKVVSVLFCDLVGFTHDSETADPEDVSARLRSYHTRVRVEIERFGGTVEKFIGDAVMAVFGAPLAHEDDAERAVRAGLRLLEAVDELNATDPTLALQVRIGINTGGAVVALGARPETGEAFVAGDVVNTASRLQGAAPVNGLAVSDQTYRVTSRVFEWERLEPVAIKGKAEPLSIWRPLRARARLGSDVTRSPDTPMVGRELERQLLSGAFARAATQATCQLVTVVGEPGVGKSRLCAELLREVEADTRLVRWRQGRCLPYGEGISFWPLGEIVKAECGILETDSPAEAADKLALKVAADDPERVWLLARLAPLVGAPADPAALEESFAAWRRFCESLAADRATVLVFEDLHWADDALLGFIEELSDWVEGVPLLLLCTARPELFERYPTFGVNARNAQRINLAPLTEAETGQLVAGLLERTLLTDATRQRLMDRAGGNPLYAEEFVRLLADRDGDAESDVPDSIQAIIAARLDTLPADRKSLLQDAAVVGKVFWAGSVAAMGDRDLFAVTQALHDLARKELVRPVRASSMAGEQEFTFWHVLVRDVCYGQIPRLDRAARHRAAAGWIERAVGDRVADLADVLAYHYLAALELHEATGDRDGQAELRADAVRTLAMAGARALVLDVARAERQLARAIELAPPDAPERASLLEDWGRAVWQQGRLREGRDAMEQALAMRRDREEWVPAARILTRLQILHHRMGDTTGRAVEEAVELLEAEPAGPELVSAYAHLAGNRALTGRDREAIEAVDRAVTLARQLDLPEPAFAVHWRGIARLDLGDAEGIDDVERALRLAIDQGLGRETGVIYGNLAGALAEQRGPAAALKAAEEGIAFCEARGMSELANRDRGINLYLSADLGRTEEVLAEAESIADRIQASGDKDFAEIREVQLRLLAERGTPRELPELRAFVAAVRAFGEPRPTAEAIVVSLQSLIAGHRRDEARELAGDLARLVTDDGAVLYPNTVPRAVRALLSLGDQELAERIVDSIGLRTASAKLNLASSQGQLAEAAGDLPGAGRRYSAAADAWEAFGNVPEQAYARLGEGRCLAALGDPGAEAPLRRARELFATLGYAPALAETAALLGATPLETSL